MAEPYRPVAEGRPVDQWRTYVASENGWSRMIRSERYKYCVYDSGEESLIDMENDPGEMRNLAGNQEHTEVLNKHRRLLKDWVETSGDTDGAKFLCNGCQDE